MIVEESLTTCDECGGNGGFYDRANGERYLSDPVGRVREEENQ